MIPGLTQAKIRQHSNDRSFARGREYFRTAAVESLTRRGDAVVARVQGSGGERYTVKIPIKQAGDAASCSCPYDFDGYCKHIVATLLACLETPEPITTAPALESQLQALDPAQLITLIQQMVDKHGDLEKLVTKTTRTPAQVDDLEKVRSKMRRILANAARRGVSSSRIAVAIDKVVADGEVYFSEGRWPEAARYVSVILEEINAAYESLYDIELDVAYTVNECVDLLGVCLDQLQDPALRHPILRTLFETFAMDIELGGIDYGEQAPELLTEQVSTEEKQEIAGWVRTLLPEPGFEEGYLSWTMERLCTILLDLEGGHADPETHLRICRETGQHDALITKLLHLGRTDEALDVFKEAPDKERGLLAAIFEENRLSELLLPFFLERLQGRHTPQDRDWLIRHTESRGGQDVALEVAEIHFWSAPTVEQYVNFRRVGVDREDWPALRQALFDRLETEQRFTLLIELCLWEGEVGKALRVLDLMQRPKPDGKEVNPPEWLPLRVARAAEAEHPLEAAELYVMVASWRIDARGRQHYAGAAMHLKHARDLYLQAGQAGAWKQVIAAIREGSRTLRLLQEALTKAGL